MFREKPINLSLDVEADGPAPGLYSMISFAVVDINDPNRFFYGELRPISTQFNFENLKATGYTREQTLHFRDAKLVMDDFRVWLRKECPNGRPIVWSDNPGFDWGFLNYYAHWAWGENPLGWSCRRIGDFYAGLVSDPKKSGHWKRLRDTKHTHNALDDARGNAEALVKILNKKYL